MNKEQYERLLNILLETGSNYAEIYYEESSSKIYEFNDSKLDTIRTRTCKGIGFRIIFKNDYYYASTNNIEFNNLIKVARRVAKNINNSNSIKKANLEEMQDETCKVKIPHSKFPTEKKKKLFAKIDKLIREKYQEIKQVNLRFVENDKIFIIANSDGKFIKSNAIRTRYICHTYAERNNRKEDEGLVIGRRKGYEFLDDFDIENESLNIASSNIEKLSSKDFKGGEMPVIINSGFGAVIFHEACGHGLEGTSAAPKLSIFSNQLNKKIASTKVTLIDDGTLPEIWGSNSIDDEGEKTKKNILIENGILKDFLIDKYSSIKTNRQSNGCSRRENYEQAPTSRMSNTYLAPGTDKIEDMFKSIKHGVYCKKLSGGQVNTTTGDFNFGVEAAYEIIDGKITDRIKGVTLIGNGKDILKNVEMVSDDLRLEDGYCGSKSGMIPVTCGQPTIKISKILVGGKE